jgi:hypothetical protein
MTKRMIAGGFSLRSVVIIECNFFEGKKEMAVAQRPVLLEAEALCIVQNFLLPPFLASEVLAARKIAPSTVVQKSTLHHPSPLFVSSSYCFS